MAHQRKLIRQAVRTLLDGATAAGARVYATRVLSLRRQELPAISVYTLEESVEGDSVTHAPRELTRGMPLIIEAWVAPGDAAAVDDAMDDIAEEIETAMHADPYLTDTAAESVLDSTTLEVVQEGDRLMGLVALTYQVTYRTFAPVAPVLDDLETVHATYNLGNEVHPDEVAQDSIAVEAA